MARRLSDTESLLMAAAKTWPDFAKGDRVRVLFSVQDPIDGEVVEPPDRNGWVRIDDGTVTFLALASCCVPLPEAGEMSTSDGLG